MFSIFSTLWRLSANNRINFLFNTMCSLGYWMNSNMKWPLSGSDIQNGEFIIKFSFSCI